VGHYKRGVAASETASQTISGIGNWAVGSLIEVSGIVSAESFAGQFNTFTLPTKGSSFTQVLRYGMMAFSNGDLSPPTTSTSGVTILNSLSQQFHDGTFFTVTSGLTGSVTFTPPDGNTSSSAWMQVNLYGSH
jgi:hypothetical protein